MLVHRLRRRSNIKPPLAQPNVFAGWVSGHDTTSSAISWILYTLAGHPDHQTQCRKELQDVVGDRNSQYIEWYGLHSDNIH